MIAKEEYTHREMCSAFEKRTVFKEYAALTAGVLDRDSDYIELRIKHHPVDRVKMFTTSDTEDLEAKDACTFYEVMERFRGHTFVRLPAENRPDAPDSHPPGKCRLPRSRR